MTVVNTGALVALSPLLTENNINGEIITKMLLKVRKRQNE